MCCPGSESSAQNWNTFSLNKLIFRFRLKFHSLDLNAWNLSSKCSIFHYIGTAAIFTSGQLSSIDWNIDTAWAAGSL